MTDGDSGEGSEEGGARKHLRCVVWVAGADDGVISQGLG